MGGKGKGSGKGKAVSAKGAGKGKGQEEKKWAVKKPTVVVTGASGFVAGHVIKCLLDKRYTVRGTVRSLEDTRKVAHLKELFPTVELFEADLVKGEAGFVKAFEGCAAVIHCASPFKLSVTDPEKDLIEPAVKGTEAVMKAAGAASVKRVVITSSCAAIGPPQAWFTKPQDADKEKVFTEADWNTDSTLQAGPYRLSKRMAEEKANELAKKLDVEVVAICPSFVLGPPLSKRADGESVELCTKMLNGEVAKAGPCGGPVAMGCVDVRDVAFAHVAGLETAEAAGKRYIASSSEGFTHLELADLLRKRFEAYPLPTEGKELIYRSRYSNELVQKELKVKLRPASVSMNSMAAALVKLGMVEHKVLLKKTKFGKVKSLNPESKGVNLLLKVVSCSTVEEKGAQINEAVAGDDSGVVTLRLGEGEVVKAGQVIAVRNGFVQMAKGHIRVRSGKWGKIAEEETTDEIVPKTDKDVSSTEYELVADR